MPKKPIVREPNKVLSLESSVVNPVLVKDHHIQDIIRDMKDTLRAADDGVGLAAPQIGESLQIFIVSEEAHFIDSERGERGMDPKKEDFKQFVFVNPKLTKHSKSQDEMIEGCLSIPGKFGTVRRYEKVSLEWLDETGKPHRRGFTKFFARVIQHEMDHLKGLLIRNRAKKLHEFSDTTRHAE